MYSSSVVDSVNNKIYLVGGRTYPSHGLDDILELDTNTGDTDTGWGMSCSKTWRTGSGAVVDHLMCVCKIVVMSWTFSAHDDNIDPVNLSMPESASAATGVRWG